jgi:hypothetical protein
MIIGPTERRCQSGLSFKGFGSFRSGEMNSQKLERSPAHQRERATAEEGQPMMRLPRTAALLAAFSLLASAATAYNRLLLVVGLLHEPAPKR